MCVSHSVMSDFCATPWTVAHQAPLSMEFSMQEYRSGVPFPSPGYLSNPGIEPRSPALWTDSLAADPPGKPYVSLMLFVAHTQLEGLGSCKPHPCRSPEKGGEGIWRANRR